MSDDGTNSGTEYDTDHVASDATETAAGGTLAREDRADADDAAQYDVTADAAPDTRRVLAAAMKRQIASSSTRRPAFAISSGRAPSGVTPAPRPQLPIAGARAPFGITPSRRMAFPISSGRAPLARTVSVATASLDDADGSKETA